MDYTKTIIVDLLKRDNTSQSIPNVLFAFPMFSKLLGDRFYVKTKNFPDFSSQEVHIF